MNLTSSNFTLRGIDHIIFDKDGTITDANLYWGEIIRRRSFEIVRFYGLDLTDMRLRSSIETAMGLGSSGVLLPEGPIAIKSRSEVIAHISDLLAKINVSSSQMELSAIFKDVHSKFIPLSVDYSPLIPGVREFLDSISTLGCSVSLATSDSYDNTCHVLRHHKLLDMFQHLVCSDSGYGDKKSGMPALHLCNMLNISPMKTICIGDSLMDYNMSRSAGLLECILVATGQIPYETLISHSNCVVHSLTDLVLE